MIKTLSNEPVEIVAVSPDYEESGWVWGRFRSYITDKVRVHDFCLKAANQSKFSGPMKLKADGGLNEMKEAAEKVRLIVSGSFEEMNEKFSDEAAVPQLKVNVKLAVMPRPVIEKPKQHEQVNLAFVKKPGF